MFLCLINKSYITNFENPNTQDFLRQLRRALYNHSCMCLIIHLAHFTMLTLVSIAILRSEGGGRVHTNRPAQVRREKTLLQ